MSKLPLSERLLLEYFFRCLIQKDSIGYVLLGGKPMSFYSYIKPKQILPAFVSTPLDELDLFFLGFNPTEALFEKGLDVWKKYEHYFCGKNIYFDVIEQDRELHYVKVAVINKGLMLSQFERYFHKFKHLDLSITHKEALFEALLHNQRFKERFYTSDDLVGICLGYGERNASLFQKRSSTLLSLGRLGFTLKQPSVRQRKSLENECSFLEKSLISFKDHDSRKFLFNLGVGFRADFTNPETCILQKKYKNLHKKLTHLYEGKNFLEETLYLIRLADNYPPTKRMLAKVD
ncbi:MAG TPA: hypothetical protein VLG76_08180 [Rhabdochlamydiaceae bacterium]|nr:hypothetical protein [Rhabdochlamydiaceae bacterium]